MVLFIMLYTHKLSFFILSLLYERAMVVDFYIYVFLCVCIVCIIIIMR